MMREGIDFLDADYENVSLGKKPRQIRTKSTSFSQIKKHFNDFRIRLLSKKLEREKDKAVTEGYSEVFGKQDEERMMKRATTIARLEEKIKILDGRTVPIDYVDKRAIKIKKAMMKNISYTSDNIYAVGIENKDAVFKPEPEVVEMDPEIRESIAANVKRIMEEKQAEEAKRQEETVAAYTPSPITKAEIRAEIDEEFAKVVKNAKKVEEVHVTEAEVQDKVEEPHINLDEIKASIDDAFKEMEANKEVPQATIGAEVVKEVVDETIESVNVDSKISLEDIKNEVDEAMDKVVSKNGAASAKVDRFNEDGSRREKYNYTPMTDEEIKAAQANIEYDKYEQIYREQHEQAKTQKEEQPVVEVEQQEKYVYTPMTDEEIKAAQENIEYDKYEQIYREQHEQAKAQKEAEQQEDKYVYTPMTDEEIKAAQANIEYDKYEEIYRAQNEIKFKTAEFKDIFKPAADGFNLDKQVVEEPVREVPIIVPEVDERFVSEKVVVSEDVPTVVSKPTSIEEFGQLKAKVEKLKQKLAESESKKNAAVQFAARTSSRAEEIKRRTIDSEKAYQDRLASLQLLAQTLEENCNLNDTAARAAAIDAECNERFISSQMAKKDQYDEAINQVDSILGFAYGEEENVVVRGRAA